MTYQVLDIAQKLIYKAQVDMANGGDRLTESWMYGPVVPCVYDTYLKYGSSALPEVSNVITLDDDEKSLFNEVYDVYREFSAIGLMNRTHSERPWTDALPHDRGTIITKESMKSFFKTQLQ